MDETASTTKPDWLNNRAKVAGERTEDVAGEDFEDESDEAWDMLSKSFRQAQTVLDENRVLIEQVNNNHESKIHDNMVKNVGLITQIHGNISKVRSIYTDLNINFSNIVRHRRVSVVNHRNREGDRKEDEDEAEKSEDYSAERVPENSEDDFAERVPEKSEIVELMAAGRHRHYPPADMSISNKNEEDKSSRKV